MADRAAEETFQLDDPQLAVVSAGTPDLMRLTVRGGDLSFDLGEFDPDKIARLDRVLELRLRDLDLGSFRAHRITDALHSWSYWSLYFWHEDDDLGVLIQNRDCVNVAFAILTPASRARWRSQLRSTSN